MAPEWCGGVSRVIDGCGWGWIVAETSSIGVFRSIYLEGDDDASKVEGRMLER